MRIRTLVAAAAVLGGVAGSFATTPAAAWECPKNITRPVYLYNPVTGQPMGKACVPDWNCETCYAVES